MSLWSISITRTTPAPACCQPEAQPEDQRNGWLAANWSVVAPQAAHTGAAPPLTGPPTNPNPSTGPGVISLTGWAARIGNWLVHIQHPCQYWRCREEKLALLAYGAYATCRRAVTQVVPATQRGEAPGYD